jgi:hypothetical protein
MEKYVWDYWLRFVGILAHIIMGIFVFFVFYDPGRTNVNATRGMAEMTSISDRMIALRIPFDSLEAGFNNRLFDHCQQLNDSLVEVHGQANLPYSDLDDFRILLSIASDRITNIFYQFCVGCGCNATEGRFRLLSFGVASDLNSIYPVQDTVIALDCYIERFLTY